MCILGVGGGGVLSRLCVCMGNGIEQTVYIGRWY